MSLCLRPVRQTGSTDFLGPLNVLKTLNVLEILDVLEALKALKALEAPGNPRSLMPAEGTVRHRVFSFAIPPASSYNNCGPRIPSIKTHNKYSLQILTARAHNKNSQLKLPVNYPPPVEAGVFFGDRIKTHNIKTARRAGTERQNLPWHLIFM